MIRSILIVLCLLASFCFVYSVWCYCSDCCMWLVVACCLVFWFIAALVITGVLVI